MLCKTYARAEDEPKTNPVGQLEECFVKLSGIPAPPRSTARDKRAASVRWWQPLAYILEIHGGDIEASTSSMSAAIRRMRAEGLTIAAPQSIVSVLLDEFGKSHGDKSKGMRVW